MDLVNIKAEDLRAKDESRLVELEGDIRREIVNTKLDFTLARSEQVGKKKGLKKSLARLLTVMAEKEQN